MPSKSHYERQGCIVVDQLSALGWRAFINGTYHCRDARTREAAIQGLREQLSHIKRTVDQGLADLDALARGEEAPDGSE